LLLTNILGLGRNSICRRNLAFSTSHLPGDTTQGEIMSTLIPASPHTQLAVKKCQLSISCPVKVHPRQCWTMPSYLQASYLTPPNNLTSALMTGYHLMCIVTFSGKSAILNTPLVMLKRLVQPPSIATSQSQSRYV